MHGHANICHVMCDYCMGVVLEEKGGGVSLTFFSWNDYIYDIIESSLNDKTLFHKNNKG